MAGIRINFAEVEGSFEPMPEGAYECIIERVEVRESKSSDHNYLNWELRVTEEGDFEDRRLWTITSFSPKALFRLKDTLVAIGAIEPDEELEFEWEDDVDITPQEGPRLLNPDVEGMAVVAVVRNEFYDGRERNRVENMTSPDDVPAQASPRQAASGRSSGGRARRKLR